MRHAFLAASLAATLVWGAGAASADHLPGHGAPDWSGVYVAASVGYGFADTAFTHAYVDASVPFDGTTTRDVSIDGVTGTVTLGYDKQLPSGVLLGVFADYTFGDIDGPGTRTYPTPPPTERFSLTYDNVWAVGARVGLVHTAQTLLYLTAGYTAADLELSDERGKIDQDLDGYFLGAGIEHNIRDGLYLKLEYRYSDYGKDTIYEDFGEGFCDPGDCYERYDADSEIHAIRLGIAYKFGGTRAPEHAALK